MKEYGIIGYPLAHSFSEKYFSEKFKKEGIPSSSYTPYPLQSINEFPALLEQHPGLMGLSVTIPYKQQVLQYLNDISNIPGGLNACNSIRIRDGELKGYNTDIVGFEKALLPHLKEQHSQALILGNGGAATAVKYVLQKLRISFTQVSRNPAEGVRLTYAGLDEKTIKENGLIINTTPLGTFPAVNECADIPYQYLTPRHLLFDLVYNPAKTLFLQKGEDRGAAIVNGYMMLVLQAEESWKIWNAG